MILPLCRVVNVSYVTQVATLYEEFAGVVCAKETAAHLKADGRILISSFFHIVI
jgi:hypothetical protein